MSTPLQIDFGPLRRAPVIGIDLGTTNSLAAFMDLTGPRIIPGADGDRLVPSVVHYGSDGRITVGNQARRLIIEEPGRTVYSVKRLMGKGLDDVRQELRLLPFRVSEADPSVIRLDLGGRLFTPPEISACILRQLRENAEAFLKAPVTQAVITVPAYFNDAQRQATRDAGRIAGLEVLRLLNEPTAAALAYGLDKRKEGIIAVYDLGGGTFDISILRLHDGIFEVLGTNGDTHLGGDDIDNRLLAIALEDLASEWGRDLSADRVAVQLLRRAVNAAKERLSQRPAATIELDYPGRKYQRELTRPHFERLIADIVDRTLEPCRSALGDAQVKVEQVDEVVLVGGSTRIPLVRRAVRRLFRTEPHTELNPEEVVALGAAVQAGILAGSVQDQLLLDVTPPVAGHRDHGRDGRKADSPELHHTGQRRAGLHNRGGRATERADPRRAGRTRAGPRLPQSGAIQVERHRAAAGRRASHRSTFPD